ncbi:MAG: peptidylprolyl isomerase [Bryobacteraceae bacterium]
MRIFSRGLAALTAFCALALAQAPAPKPVAAKPKPVAAAPKPAAPKPAPAKPAAAAAKPAAADPNDPVLITVGTQKITRTQFESLYAVLPDGARARYNGPEGKKQLAEQMAELFALADEARRRKVDQDPKVRDQIRVQTDQILATSLMQNYANSGGLMDESALRDYFDQHKSEYMQVQGRHILIRFKGSPVPVREGQKDLTEEESLAKVQDLRKRISGGEDFAALAKSESDDVGSGSAGGSLGTFGKGQMVKPFEDVAFSLPVGQLSEPVKTQFGYHLIQVQEQKNQKFEDARPMIEQRLKSERPRQLAEEIKKKAGIVVADPSFFR